MNRNATRRQKNRNRKNLNYISAFVLFSLSAMGVIKVAYMYMHYSILELRDYTSLMNVLVLTIILAIDLGIEVLKNKFVGSNRPPEIARYGKIGKLLLFVSLMAIICMVMLFNHGLIVPSSILAGVAYYLLRASIALFSAKSKITPWI